MPEYFHDPGGRQVAVGPQIRADLKSYSPSTVIPINFSSVGPNGRNTATSRIDEILHQHKIFEKTTREAKMATDYNSRMFCQCEKCWFPMTGVLSYNVRQRCERCGGKALSVKNETPSDAEAFSAKVNEYKRRKRKKPTTDAPWPGPGKRTKGRAA